MSAGVASVGGRDAPSVTDGGGTRRTVQGRMPDTEGTRIHGCEAGAEGAENPSQTWLSLCPVFGQSCSMRSAIPGAFT